MNRSATAAVAASKSLNQLGRGRKSPNMPAIKPAVAARRGALRPSLVTSFLIASLLPGSPVGSVSARAV